VTGGIHRTVYVNWDSYNPDTDVVVVQYAQGLNSRRLLNQNGHVPCVQGSSFFDKFVQLRDGAPKRRMYGSFRLYASELLELAEDDPVVHHKFKSGLEKAILEKTQRRIA